jgi:hypothetical protein
MSLGKVIFNAAEVLRHASILLIYPGIA